MSVINHLFVHYTRGILYDLKTNHLYGLRLTQRKTEKERERESERGEGRGMKWNSCLFLFIFYDHIIIIILYYFFFAHRPAAATAVLKPILNILVAEGFLENYINGIKIPKPKT